MTRKRDNLVTVFDDVGYGAFWPPSSGIVDEDVTSHAHTGGWSAPTCRAQRAETYPVVTSSPPCPHRPRGAVPDNRTIARAGEALPYPTVRMILDADRGLTCHAGAVNGKREANA